MLIAIAAHVHTGGASECGWYFVVYFLDCSLGLTLAITFHTAATRIARAAHARRHTVELPVKYFSTGVEGGPDGGQLPWWEALVEIGHYGDAGAPDLRRWAVQVGAWVTCVVTARSIVGVVVLGCSPVFAAFTTRLDARFTGHPNAYLYTVMVAIPLVVNIGQAWVQDQVLKWKVKKSSGKREEEEEEWGDVRDATSSPEGVALLQLLLPVAAGGPGATPTQRNR